MLNRQGFPLILPKYLSSENYGKLTPDVQLKKLGLLPIFP